MNVKQRQAIERRIAKLTIQTLLDEGYQVSVHDGEEFVLKRSTDVPSILGVMFSTDEDYLYAFFPGELHHEGWVRFIYGNDGWDVISDYTTSLNDVMEPLAERIEHMEPSS